MKSVRVRQPDITRELNKLLRETQAAKAARRNVLRHRIGPDTHAQLIAGQFSGQLQVQAANIERVRPEENKVSVHLRGGKMIAGNLVINATGPNNPSLLLL